MSRELKPARGAVVPMDYSTEFGPVDGVKVQVYPSDSRDDRLIVVPPVAEEDAELSRKAYEMAKAEVSQQITGEAPLASDVTRASLRIFNELRGQRDRQRQAAQVSRPDSPLDTKQGGSAMDLDSILASFGSTGGTQVPQSPSVQPLFQQAQPQQPQWSQPQPTQQPQWSQPQMPQWPQPQWSQPHPQLQQPQWPQPQVPQPSKLYERPLLGSADGFDPFAAATGQSNSRPAASEWVLGIDGISSQPGPANFIAKLSAGPQDDQLIYAHTVVANLDPRTHAVESLVFVCDERRSLSRLMESIYSRQWDMRGGSLDLQIAESPDGVRVDVATVQRYTVTSAVWMFRLGQLLLVTVFLEKSAV